MSICKRQLSYRSAPADLPRTSQPTCTLPYFRFGRLTRYATIRNTQWAAAPLSAAVHQLRTQSQTKMEVQKTIWFWIHRSASILSRTWVYCFRLTISLLVSRSLCRIESRFANIVQLHVFLLRYSIASQSHDFSGISQSLLESAIPSRSYRSSSSSCLIVWCGRRLIVRCCVQSPASLGWREVGGGDGGGGGACSCFCFCFFLRLLLILCALFKGAWDISARR